ncbi:hypothetical protein PIB30_068393 [Stylosanthes scabra]|uniref:Uncharacterized protein n=1 Tax=Stylosanthes scabra TaxID=79078 RepID=A0ABU6VQA5_9FABA|nr:hypothetical protein [Stylosanthes scabra]
MNHSREEEPGSIVVSHTIADQTESTSTVTTKRRIRSSEKLDGVESKRALRQPFKLEPVPEKPDNIYGMRIPNPWILTNELIRSVIRPSRSGPVANQWTVSLKAHPGGKQGYGLSRLPNISLASSLYPRRTTELRGITPLLPSLKDSEGTSLVPPGGKQG